MHLPVARICHQGTEPWAPELWTPEPPRRGPEPPRPKRTGATVTGPRLGTLGTPGPMSFAIAISQQARRHDSKWRHHSKKTGARRYHPCATW
ncbi:hypothetical protein CLV63_102398 [Murinocardiopsis flavida]|uniref:Uncharacterized protein n=1 Tax=Murinocardiopsis flavida TaxID=645275 RepID=A0A2P8DST5_9ACTN|nr:hypothetical protein CLV63_102398 [Murinocardiopsis flavida]